MDLFNDLCGCLGGGRDMAAFIVVMAVDQSEHSQYTFSWYVRHVHRPENEVHFIHVPEYWGDVARIMTPAKMKEMVELTRSQTESLRVLYTEAAARHKLNAKFSTQSGSEAWHEIIKYAEKVDAGAIVMGTRGQGTVKRTLMGSVSDSVLHHSPVPVIVCRSKEIIKQQD